MEFGLIIPNIMEGEVVFHLRNPSCRVRSIKFMHLNFGHIIPGMGMDPMRVGIMRMLKMGGVNILRVGLRVLPPDKLCQCVELFL
jgi:hypothetical protein